MSVHPQNHSPGEDARFLVPANLSTTSHGAANLSTTFQVEGAGLSFLHPCQPAPSASTIRRSM
eukprot:1695880-Pyramimonas_sp.AAC.2